MGTRGGVIIGGWSQYLVWGPHGGLGGGPAIWGGLWGSHPLQCDFFIFHLPLGAVHLGGGERKVRGGQKKLGRGLGGGGSLT